MKLVYTDPYESGIKIVDCSGPLVIEQILESLGMTESNYGGEVIHYAYISKDGTVTKAMLDFT